MERDNPTLQPTPNQFSIRTLFLLSSALSAALAFGVSVGMPAVCMAVVGTILALRPILVFRARSLLLSLPLLVLTIALPVAMVWPEIAARWYTTNRPDPLSVWIGWAILYSLLPLAAWIADALHDWNTTKSKLIRTTVEIPILFAWIWISLSILIDMVSHN